MSSRIRYSVEFKKMIVQLYESGTSVTDLTSEYGIASATIYNCNDHGKHVKFGRCKKRECDISRENLNANSKLRT